MDKADENYSNQLEIKENNNQEEFKEINLTPIKKKIRVSNNSENNHNNDLHGPHLQHLENTFNANLPSSVNNLPLYNRLESGSKFKAHSKKEKIESNKSVFGNDNQQREKAYQITNTKESQLSQKDVNDEVKISEIKISSEKSEIEYESDFRQELQLEIPKSDMAKDEKAKTRKIYINQNNKNKRKYNYKNNFIKTSKYNVFTFLPLSLLLQFKRYANIYFVAVSCLQFVPILSSLNAYSILLPILILMALSMLRELIEDIRAHQADNKENKTKVVKLINSKFQGDILKNIQVGEIIRIEENNIIPADMILLTTSNISKSAFVETISLDGEKNLKPKYSISQFQHLFNNMSNIIRLRGSIICDLPNAEISKFNGIIKLNNKNHHYLNLKNFLNKGNDRFNKNFRRNCIKKHKMGDRSCRLYRYGDKNNGKFNKEICI